MSVSDRFDKNWDDVARNAGYINERDMLENMYLGADLSLKQIGERLGCSGHAVMHHLDKWGIERRSRGGNNNTAQQTRKLFRLDQRVILFGDLNEIAKTVGVSSSLLWKYRKSIKENLPWNFVYSPQPQACNDTQSSANATSA